VIQLPVKSKLFWIVVHPDLIVETKTARNLLPRAISLATAIEQWGNLGGLITGLLLDDTHLLKKSLKDSIAEPIRADLIPGFYDAKYAAMEAGALGFSISGSGPSVFAIATSQKQAIEIEARIKQIFLDTANIETDTYISSTNQEGAMVLEQSS
jgi:homoserine kinase